MKGLTASKPSRRLMTVAKRKEKEVKEKRKKNSTIEKPKFCQNCDFCACPTKNVVNLAEIQPENHQRMSKKTHFWQKAPGVNGSIKLKYASASTLFFATLPFRTSNFTHLKDKELL